ncbi:MAG: hypothetical protein AUF79_14515 [Crenarchaeota archaeon 13_1_20CM_2_51_8]|nr:MAG: hypothetical protein AUF79_14515 [Crenarchaeota archaeon 13_1_20CM_2_51_8]
MTRTAFTPQESSVECRHFLIEWFVAGLSTPSLYGICAFSLSLRIAASRVEKWVGAARMDSTIASTIVGLPLGPSGRGTVTLTFELVG